MKYNTSEQVSLELFLTQYHLWLAFDTQGLLVVLPGHPWANAMLTTVVFVVVANELAKAFRQLCHRMTSSLVPGRTWLLVGIVAVTSMAGAARWQL